MSLNNLSVVPVTFSLKVLADGHTPSLSYKKFASLTVKPRLPAFPRQFQIEPQESVVEPFSSKKVTVKNYKKNILKNPWQLIGSMKILGNFNGK